jgi:hypothetical protein
VANWVALSGHLRLCRATTKGKQYGGNLTEEKIEAENEKKEKTKEKESKRKRERRRGRKEGRKKERKKERKREEGSLSTYYSFSI